MDNAVKALIIAGAVLIAILLIGVGIMVFNAANDPLNQAQTSGEQQAVQMFNEPIMANLGPDISGQQARALLSAISASNAKNSEDRQINVTGQTTVSSISLRKRYTTTESYTNGYITGVNISEIGSSTTTTTTTPKP